MLDQILATTQSESLTFNATIAIILSALVLGLCISLVYRFTHRGQVYADGFTVTLIMLPAIVAMIILLVGSNVARAVQPGWRFQPDPLPQRTGRLQGYRLCLLLRCGRSCLRHECHRLCRPVHGHTLRRDAPPPLNQVWPWRSRRHAAQDRAAGGHRLSGCIRCHPAAVCQRLQAGSGQDNRLWLTV